MAHNFEPDMQTHIKCQNDKSKEVLWVSVGRLASKLQAVNVLGLKKILPIGHLEPWLRGVGRSAEFFSNLQH